MKITIISDTHNKHAELIIPPSDILIHAGDFSNHGKFFEVRDFVEWFKIQPATHKILVCGNHEIGLEKTSLEELTRFTFGREINYLFNSSITLEGIKFWGSPMTPRFFDWAFNIDRDKIHKYWDEIPEDTDVLITHGPPAGILDQNDRDERCGCEALRDRIFKLPNIKHSVFGHMHGPGGQSIQIRGTKFHNCAIVNDRHQVVNKPTIIEYE